MAIFEIKSPIEALEKANLRQVRTEIVTNFPIKDQKIKSLFYEVAELDGRVNECEVYSANDRISLEI